MLIAASKEGPVRFAHAAQVARDARAVAAQIAEATAKLQKARVRIITQDQARAAKSLKDLTADEKRDPITPTQHKKCPGHAAYIAESWREVETVYVCTDWRANGHHSRWGTWQDKPTPAAMTTEEADALSEKERQKRRTVIENNKAWASAETVRRGWLKTFLTRKSLPKGAVVFLATELAHCDYALRKALESNGLLPELLGCKGGLDLASTAEKATDARAQVIALGVILAALESDITREAWRTPQPAHKRYLRFLASIGYELSDVEQLVIGKPKPARKTRTSPAQAAQPDPAGNGKQTADAGEQPQNGQAA